MATTTIYPSGGTYVSPASKNTDHSGASNLQTGYYFKSGAINSETNWNYASQKNDDMFACAFLKFTRPAALKYAKINSVTLTYTIDGFGGNGEQFYNQVWGKAAYAPYSTSYPLSAITWNSVRQNGIFGEFVDIGSNANISAPASRTIDITALFSGDQSGEELVIAIAAGQGSYGSGYYQNESHLVKSSCYLTVTYEPGTQPAPTPLYPKDQTLIESGSTLFAWQFNSETAAVQTAAELQYKLASAQSYTTVSLTQSGYSYTLNQALPAGSYQWRVKVTNDAGETSTYSEVANFNIVGKPAVPIINEPANKALTEITWNTSSQQSCEIVLSDQSGKELVHETLATAETSYKPNMFLKGQYLVKVRVMNDSLMWSEWSQKGFTISAAGPAAATMSIIAGAGIPAVRIGYTLPADVSAALMRRQNDETKIIAQLAPELPEYIDDTVSAGTAYEYFIRTYVNGYTDTAPATASVQFDGAIFQIGDEYLNLKASDEQFLPHSEEISAPYALNEYSGRSYYVIERGETINVIITRRFYVAQEQKAMLDRMSLMESVFYRDNKENAFRAAVLKTTYDAHMGDGYLATINIVRLNEEEVAVNV